MNKNNTLYSQLTSVEDTEQSAKNFLESLIFRSNGYKLIDILNSLENFSIVEGFLHKELIDSDPINTFKRCVIELQEDAKVMAKLLKANTNIKSVKALTDSKLEIILK